MVLNIKISLLTRCPNLDMYEFRILFVREREINRSLGVISDMEPEAIILSLSNISAVLS